MQIIRGVICQLELLIFSPRFLFLLEIDSEDGIKQKRASYNLFKNTLLAKSSANLMLTATITVNENT